MSEVEPEAQTNAIRLHDQDNVVIAMRRIRVGETVAGVTATPAETIPAGHKMATARIAVGQPVIKYGQVIGAATRDIAPGEHVHLHNLAVTAARLGAMQPAAKPAHVEPRSFQGYRRSSGRVGVRNYVGIVTSVNCSATVARLIAEAAERSRILEDYPNVDGVVPITHASGCGMAGSGEGFDMLRRTLWGTAANPNFGAVMLVGLGCEVIQTAKLVRDFGLADRAEFRSFTIQDVGGTRRAVEHGLDILREMLPIANSVFRETVPASELILGLQCGGSDAWSGITANAALGAAVDLLVAQGGTAFLSETPEIYGAEHLLYARAQSQTITDKLRARLEWWERYTALHGAEMNNNPSPGNKAGGLTTILEKSLGAVAKGGSSALTDVIGYAEQTASRGLVFMDSPGFDPCSATGQVASGATVIIFTTGRGSAFGFKPSPSIKLSSNTAIYRLMTDDIDIDCGPIAAGASISDKAEEILAYILDVASGRRTKSEELGYGGAEFVPWLLGATM